MPRHQLLGRNDDEILWFQRRGFMQAAAAWAATGGFVAAQAQQRGNVVEQHGDAMVNDRRLLAGQTIQTGDSIETGPRSHLIFVIGGASFQVRQNSLTRRSTRTLRDEAAQRP